MSADNNNQPEDQLSADNSKRREALVKLGKYAAYTAPAMLVTTNATRAFAQPAPGTQVTTTTSGPTTTALPTTTNTTTAAPTTTPAPG